MLGFEEGTTGSKMDKKKQEKEAMTLFFQLLTSIIPSMCAPSARNYYLTVQPL